MSRAINLPSQSVKLTNVATVRLTVNGKRFEVACYKNKVLDYRAGLEKDLAEVLQTSNIHIFTNVGKGQFAAAADLQAAFGATATQEEIAVQILQRGKSLQVSEGERTQLYESCLTQVATQIAINCIHPETGKSYTVTQIKHALTQHHHYHHFDNNVSNEQGMPSNGKKGKKTKSSKQLSQPILSFTIQPHKPIKQQYLQALKYLQAAEILPIARASMELQWQYDASQEEAVILAMSQLDILESSTNSMTNPANATTVIRTFTVDPSVYRPLHELTLEKVPGSRLEILKQQVFQASSGTTNKVAPTRLSHKDDGDKESDSESDSEASNDLPAEPEPSVNSDSSSDDTDVLLSSRQRKKATTKQRKKDQRRRVLDLQDDEEEDDDDDDEVEVSNSISGIPPNTIVKPSAVTSYVNEPSSRIGASKSQIVEASASNVTLTTTTDANLVSCNTCVGASFGTQSEYRAHFRSDWHRFNQKLKLQGAQAISLLEFEQCDSESFFSSNLM